MRFLRTMRPSLFLYILLVTLPTSAQIASLKIVGVAEPPELSGTPKKVIKPSEADTAGSRHYPYRALTR